MFSKGQHIFKINEQIKNIYIIVRGVAHEKVKVQSLPNAQKLGIARDYNQLKGTGQILGLHYFSNLQRKAVTSKNLLI